MPATNKYPTSSYLQASSMSFPAEHAETVTPSDSTDLVVVSRALWIGGAGNISVVMASGATVTFSGIVAGTLLPIRVSRVKATSTTATNIIAVS
jgi:hypothetical protein